MPLLQQLAPKGRLVSNNVSLALLFTIGLILGWILCKVGAGT